MKLRRCRAKAAAMRLIIAVLLAGAGATAALAGTLAGRASVIDGATLEIENYGDTILN